jgi:glutamate carboxypeptidase
MRFFTVFALCMLVSSCSSSERRREKEENSDTAFLRELVSISSGTADVAGVNAVQAHIAARMTSLGLKVEWIENSDSKTQSGKMLVGTFKGADPRYITLVGHADTVFEKLNPFNPSPDGKSATGSGVSDEKGGVIVGLNAFAEVMKSAPKYSLRLIVTPSEETGSHGFTSVLKKFSEDSVFVIGLEPVRPNGDFVIGRKGLRWYEVHVKGKEAHAGMDHENGVNACHQAALLAARLQEMTDYSKGTTLSIGHIEGGKDKFNIVCGEAIVKIDIRYANEKTGRELFQKIESLFRNPVVKSARTGDLAEVSFEIRDEAEPFSSSPETLKYLPFYLKSVKELEGRDIRGEVTGGVGDLNKMVRDGQLMVDGMGAIGSGYHTAAEAVDLTSLQTRARALSQFILGIESTLKL